MVQVSCCDRLSFTVFCIYALFTKKIKRILKSNKKLKKEKKTHIISLKTEVVGRPNCAANKTIFVCFYTFCWRLFFGAILSLSPPSFTVRFPSTVIQTPSLTQSLSRPYFFVRRRTSIKKKKSKQKKKTIKKSNNIAFPFPFLFSTQGKNKQTNVSFHSHEITE